ncbi:MAG: hypothetical protein EOT05_03255 [Candidatus Microsaccharimonas sossegonensis]|uniref:Uncharacterized protein n=1 Tax=Candidatus Microsaccharimonas sossegonensis TaxID=2506948 RepID=A0A4Q0AI72_9BACT|nr:MAG: hypothetical protein EOT05_03255 [Candidatus Microsaccharimonas sossegonensis]
MKKLVSGIIGTQEIFELDGRIRISREFDQEQATAMGIHRAQRIGELALTEPTRGFKRMVSGLWIPHSATENNAVTQFPETFMRTSAHFVRNKVFEKYLGEGTEHAVAEVRVAVWAQLASDNQQRAIANKYDEWRENGRQKAVDMNSGITYDGFVNRRHSEHHSAVMGSIASYLADLKSYIAHPDAMNGVRRKWTQDGWTKVRNEQLEWTQNFMKKQPDWEFDRFFIETYYNHRSRAKFWYDVIQKSRRMREDIILQRRLNTWREDMIRRGYDVSKNSFTLLK